MLELSSLSTLRRRVVKQGYTPNITSPLGPPELKDLDEISLEARQRQIREQIARSLVIERVRSVIEDPLIRRIPTFPLKCSSIPSRPGSRNTTSLPSFSRRSRHIEAGSRSCVVEVTTALFATRAFWLMVWWVPIIQNCSLIYSWYRCTWFVFLVKSSTPTIFGRTLVGQRQRFASTLVSNFHSIYCALKLSVRNIIASTLDNRD